MSINLACPGVPTHAQGTKDPHGTTRCGKPVTLTRSTGDQMGPRGGSKTLERIMTDEFDGLDATETAGIGAALNRCRALAAKIANELRTKRPEHFVDKLLMADIHASLERVADVLSTVKGSPARVRRRRIL